MKESVMLTTYDNPFNPFTEFEAWFKYDMTVTGHNTCGTLAREACTSSVVSDEINKLKIQEAMDRLVEEFPMVFKKVRKSDYQRTAKG